MRWVAGIHRNTDNPHIHLLIHRGYVDRGSRRAKQLTTFQRDLRISWSNEPNGERNPHPGLLSLAFEKHLDRNIERVKAEREKTEQKLREDREVLGRAMLAEDAAERLKEMRDAAITLGERRRYKIVDGRGHSRWLSENDLGLKAEAKADRAMARLSPGWLPDVRRQMRNEAIAEEMAQYQPAIQQIREMRQADLDWAEVKWQQARQASRPLLTKAAATRAEYEAAGKAAPAPELTREELNRLQGRAVAIGDAERFRMLEAIRVNLATEKGQPVRTSEEARRLRAQLFVSRSALMVEQEASRGFEETKHLRRWTIGEPIKRSGGGIEFSLTEVERELVWQTDQAKFIGERKLHWDDVGRAAATERAVALRQQREQLLERIAAERERYSLRTAAREDMVAALQDTLNREAAAYQRTGLELPEAIFTETEMKELAAHADRRRDPGFHRELSKLERDHDAQVFGIPMIFADRVGRAKAREAMASIAVREAQVASQRFADQRSQMTVIVKDDGGRNIQLGKLADVEPRTPLEQLFRPLIERSERYRLVVVAVEEHGNRLQQRLEQATESQAMLRADARDHEQEFSRWNPNQPLPRPQFTAWEVGRLEQHAMKETDPTLREQYEQLYRETIADRRNDSATREKETDRNELARTIVLEDREAAGIFDQSRAWEREDSRLEMSFTR